MRRRAERPVQTSSISAKRRLALVAGTKVTPKAVLDMPDADINYGFLLDNQIPVSNIRVGGFTPAMLRERGATDAQAFRALGFDALHLINNAFLEDAVSVYGHSDLVSTFLQTPYDAVALANATVMQILSLTTNRLMEECAGFPTEAVAVLHQIDSIAGLSITTLLDTGIRGPQLSALGYGYHHVQSTTGADSRQMVKLQMAP